MKFTSGATCITPCKLEMRRKDDLRADMTSEGYKLTYILIQSKRGGPTLGSILLGGAASAPWLTAPTVPATAFIHAR